MLKIITFALLITTLSPAQTAFEGWDVFARVKFSEKFFKELNEYYLVPFLDSRIRAYEGKQFTLKGHYLPMDVEGSNVIILSKHPYSMCFFCGGAGPESVAEVYFSSKRPRLKADQVITVKGRLVLNDTDTEHMNFILKEAVVVPAPF